MVPICEEGLLNLRKKFSIAFISSSLKYFNSFKNRNVYCYSLIFAKFIFKIIFFLKALIVKLPCRARRICQEALWGQNYRWVASITRIFGQAYSYEKWNLSIGAPNRATTRWVILSPILRQLEPFCWNCSLQLNFQHAILFLL